MIINFEQAKAFLAINGNLDAMNARNETMSEIINAVRHDVLREVLETLVTSGADQEVIEYFTKATERCAMLGEASWER